MNVLGHGRRRRSPALAAGGPTEHSALVSSGRSHAGAVQIRQSQGMLAEAHIVLWGSDRTFRLPAEGTRSLIFRFDVDDSVGLGGYAISLDGEDFAPGSEHEVTIDFWADDYAREGVREGGTFIVWYGGDIGEGRVTALR